MENVKMNKLTIITSSYRINNLTEIKKSINFDYIDEFSVFGHFSFFIYIIFAIYAPVIYPRFQTPIF